MSNWPFPYFKPEELLGKGGPGSALEQWEVKGNLLMDADHINRLCEFRESIGLPFLCNFGTLWNRGFRTPEANWEIHKEKEKNKNLSFKETQYQIQQYYKKSLQNGKFSRHVLGHATDITCPDMPIREFFARALDFGFGGIGFYPENNFLHLDSRKFIDPNDRYKKLEKMVVWLGFNQRQVVVLENYGYNAKTIEILKNAKIL